MKIDWLITNLTTFGSPDRDERAIWEVILGRAVFWPIQAVFVIREPLCDIGTSS